MRETALRLGLLAAAVAAAAGCSGSSRTTAPTTAAAAASVGDPVPSTAVVLPSTTTSLATATTASKYLSPGEKHPLPGGGTLSVSYPSNSVRPPAGVPPAPAGRSWAVMSVTFCSAKDGAPVPARLVDPARFQVEVPGQGFVRFEPGTPEIRKPALAPVEVASGTCVSGTVGYQIGGELHIEAVLYDSGEGVLRWAA